MIVSDVAIALNATAPALPPISTHGSLYIDQQLAEMRWSVSSQKLG
ncbi:MULTISPECIES: hypothetical protein [Cyanophyceae]|uniref:Uncharacterized protein n=1 Tax=Leptolyngbya subtilissima DQ-A4 TaxID=2933933 RepID=A0ABV0JZM7_9CYAN|nr:hypothetical protein [Nodosilinea sp. FACHB-141]MBD2112610.1 hypothetical protein [Nodosilinea sp. FACHB-141]